MTIQTDYTYHCPKVSTPPVIAGLVDDPEWQLAPVVELVNSEDGSPAKQPTQAQMCWDDECLYVAFKVVDKYIVATMTEHDDTVCSEEAVEIFINPSGDLMNYFEYEVSPRNVVFDPRITNPDMSINPGISTDWHSHNLRTAVVVDGVLNDISIHSRGYSVEMAIPFADMFVETPKPGEIWRANLFRIDRHPEGDEFQSWSPTLHVPAAFHVPQRFGRIVFEA